MIDPVVLCDEGEKPVAHSRIGRRTGRRQRRITSRAARKRLVDNGDAAAAAQVNAHAEARIAAMLQQLDDPLAAHGGPWLLGPGYSAADPYTWMLCRWTRGFESRPARDYAHIGPYLQRLLERPALWPSSFGSARRSTPP